MQLSRAPFVRRGCLAHTVRPATLRRLPRSAPAGKQETSSTALLTNAEVSFQVPYRVLFGQQICITGGCDELGNWDPSNAVPLVWTDGDVWTTACHLPTGAAIDYKYIIKSEFSSQVVWQTCNNMIIDLAEAESALEVRDSWDGSDHVILSASEAGSVNQTTSSVDDLMMAAGPGSTDTSTVVPVSVPVTADADALANNLLAKAMDEELVKTSIERMSLEKVKEMMTQHGLPARGRKDQMVDQLKQQLSQNGVTTSKA